MNRTKLLQDLQRDEGLKLKPYRDTVGKLTIGIGRNLDDRGITHAEAMHLASNDIEIVEYELDRNASWWRDMPEPGRRALANMMFNLGWPRLREFKNMLAALKAGKWDRAADEALDSEWAKQVGERSKRIAALFRSCAVS